MYYPEANVLVPIGDTEPLSNIPAYKSIVISLRPSAAAAGPRPRGHWSPQHDEEFPNVDPERHE